jgi:hypothetical protein
MPSKPLEPGDPLRLGRFELLARLGEGGQGISEPQTAQCVAGTVTLTRHGANLAYRWTDNIEQNTATLHRT